MRVYSDSDGARRGLEPRPRRVKVMLYPELAAQNS